MLSAEVRDRYAEGIAFWRGAGERLATSGPSPEPVAEAVANAIEAAVPSARYVVGGPELLEMAALPDEERDTAVMQLMGLTPPATRDR